MTSALRPGSLVDWEHFPSPLEYSESPLSKAFNQPVLLGLFLPIQAGGWSASTLPRSTDWSFDYNRDLVLHAEKLGFDLVFALSQWLPKGGYGGVFNGQALDSFATTAALTSVTSRIMLISTIHVLYGPLHPLHLAKWGATLDHISGGRWGINVVTGHREVEHKMFGWEQIEHDQRYARSEEFIRSLKGVWTQDNFSFAGKYYQFKDYTLKPKPVQQPHPEIFQGGTSRAARDMASRVSDWYFANGNTVEGIREQIEDLRAKAKQNQHQVKVGLNAFIIARDTEEEAQAVLREIIANANPEAVNAFADATRQAGAASPEGEGNWAKSSFEDLVQYNDGFKTNLIGTPEQIAERIVAYKAAGVDLILAGFLHFIEEVEYFGQRVLPLVRELEQKQQQAKEVA